VNGDGFADFAIVTDTPGGIVCLGGMDGLSDQRTIPVPFLDYPMHSAGDVNADGFTDIATIPSSPGAELILLFGGPAGPSTSGVQRIPGPAGFGASLSGGSDVDADGYDDVVVGMPDSAQVYVFHGAPSGLRSDSPELIHGAPGSQLGLWVGM
jgi:hypothetical protein